jgi:hypothetical protein
MITADQTAERLAAIAENMAMIVDKGLRARLSSEYLTVLDEYHSGRKGRDFPGRVKGLLARVMAGRKHYKLLPGLGTISERFYAAYGNAVKSLERLGAMADRQPDRRTRDAWTGWLKDIGFQLQKLLEQAEFSSANVALSRLDALANQVNNLLASQLLPAEMEWRKRMNQAPMRYESTEGRSGAVAKAIYPQSFNPGYSVPAASLAQKKRPYYRKARIGPTGHGPALSGLWEDFKDVVTEGWSKAKDTVSESVGDIERVYRGAAARASALRQAQAEQNASIEAMRGSDPERAEALSETLSVHKTRLDSAVAQLSGIAAEMSRYSYDSLDAPLDILRQAGLGQTASEAAGDKLITAATGPATWLLFADRIRAADAELGQLQRDSEALSAQLNSWSPVKVAAVAGGGGLALAAAAVGAFIFLRGRK